MHWNEAFQTLEMTKYSISSKMRNELWNLESFVEIIREMDNLYSIGTCLVIVIISICFLLVAGILIPNSDLKSGINDIFLQDT
jgi:hypothetical protein